MEASIIVAMIGGGAAIVGAWLTWQSARAKGRSDAEASLRASQAALIAQHAEDAQAARERAAAEAAKSDAHEQEADRLRGLLRVFITWVGGGAMPPPPTITETDLWGTHD